MMWLMGYSPSLPSNLGISEVSLVGMEGQARSWAMGSLINFLKLGKLSPTM